MAKTKAILIKERFHNSSYCPIYSKKISPSMSGVKRRKRRRRIIMKRRLNN
jgi:hypothetical protein